MSEKRKCGVLLPVSSLPSKYGIGCFDKSAYEFVDQLKAAGQSYWQILPLGTDQLRRFAVSVFFHICRKSIFYQFGRTDQRRCPDEKRMRCS